VKLHDDESDLVKKLAYAIIDVIYEVDLSSGDRLSAVGNVLTSLWMEVKLPIESFDNFVAQMREQVLEDMEIEKEPRPS
jgi:hypothetical protein